jgi:acyl carrier protein
MEEIDFVRLIEVVSESDPGSLTLDTALEDFGWDSLAVISLISELDRIGGHSINADSVASAVTVRDLFGSAFS